MNNVMILFNAVIVKAVTNRQMRFFLCLRDTKRSIILVAEEDIYFFEVRRVFELQIIQWIRLVISYAEMVNQSNTITQNKTQSDTGTARITNSNAGKEKVQNKEKEEKILREDTVLLTKKVDYMNNLLNQLLNKINSTFLCADRTL